MAQAPNNAVRKLSTLEAAALLGVSKAFLDKLRIYGGGPVFLKIGRRVLYDPRDVEAWASARRRTNTSDPAP
jgi:predicted DNA-binding transcriptional regulator AlpA